MPIGLVIFGHPSPNTHAVLCRPLHCTCMLNSINVSFVCQSSIMAWKATNHFAGVSALNRSYLIDCCQRIGGDRCTLNYLCCCVIDHRNMATKSSLLSCSLAPKLKVYTKIHDKNYNVPHLILMTSVVLMFSRTLSYVHLKRGMYSPSMSN